jgi:hypothetical protein
MLDSEGLAKLVSWSVTLNNQMERYVDEPPTTVSCAPRRMALGSQFLTSNFFFNSSFVTRGFPDRDMCSAIIAVLWRLIKRCKLCSCCSSCDQGFFSTNSRSSKPALRHVPPNPALEPELVGHPHQVMYLSLVTKRVSIEYLRETQITSIY